MPPPMKELTSVGHIVIFKDTMNANVIANNARNIARRYGIRVHETFTNALKGFATQIPQAVIQRMMANESSTIESIEEDFAVQAFTQTIPWGVTRVNVLNSNGSPLNGTSSPIDAHIFILDTGVESRHPDIHIVESLSFVRSEKNATDFNGHGTAVAGVAAARDNTAQVVGVAHGAKIHAYKVLDRNGSGSFSSVIAGIDRAMSWKSKNPSAQNRVVINLSLGAYVGTTAYNSLDNAVKKAIETGITCVVAAGNSGDFANFYSPAHVAEAITVGAYDQGDKYAPWSNHGNMVDILAPGVNILTTGRRSVLVVASGTSFAAPHVAGAAARILAANPTYTPAQLIENLGKDTANVISVNFANTTDKSVYVV